MRAQTCLRTNDCGRKRAWAQTCVGTNLCGHKRVWAQTCEGTNVSGHKQVWAQSSLGTNVCGHNRVWAQTCVGKNVWGHKRVRAQSCVDTNVCGHNRVLAQTCLGTIVWAQVCMGTNVWSPFLMIAVHRCSSNFSSITTMKCCIFDTTFTVIVFLYENTLFTLHYISFATMPRGTITNDQSMNFSSKAVRRASNDRYFTEWHSRLERWLEMEYIDRPQS